MGRMRNNTNRGTSPPHLYMLSWSKKIKSVVHFASW